MSTLHEQAWDEATRRFGGDETRAEQRRADWKDGFLAGHEAATADDDARITRLVGVVTATTMLGPQDAETVVRALVAHAATRTRVVTTVTELDALPVGVGVRSADPDDRHLYVFDATEGCWQAYRLLDCVSAEEIALPARVLREP
ncbi:hypothetical protein [Stenotrophomonas virus Jojan60]|nr:hypothetical protein [Stenotrophomonas virus Jojan60]